MFISTRAFFRPFFITFISILALPAIAATLYGKPLSIKPRWLTAGIPNQSLNISLEGQPLDEISKLKIDLGDSIEVDSYNYQPKLKELSLEIKSVSKEAALGPRILTIKIPVSNPPPGINKYKYINSQIWIFSPGRIKVNQSASRKKNIIRVSVIGENTHFKKGQTRVVFKKGMGFSVKPDSIVVQDTTHLTALVKVNANARPGKHSFYVETLKNDQKETEEIIFAPKAFKWFSSSGQILDQRKIWGRPKNDWSAMLGGLAMVTPDYEGSDDFQAQGFPFLDVSWRNRFFINFQQGMGINIIRNENFVFGTSIGYYGRREEEDNDALKGLGDVDGGIDGRIFVFIPVGPISLTSMYRHDLMGNHEGSIFSLGALYFKPLIPKLRVMVQGRLNFASEGFMNTYFDITPTQALRSGLPVYDAEAGLKDITIFNILIYGFTQHWNAVSFIGFSRLLDDAANSPIVADRGTPNQFRFGLGLTYRF